MVNLLLVREALTTFCSSTKILAKKPQILPSRKFLLGSRTECQAGVMHCERRAVARYHFGFECDPRGFTGGFVGDY